MKSRVSQNDVNNCFHVTDFTLHDYKQFFYPKHRAQVFKLSDESCVRNNKGIVEGSHSRNTFTCQMLSGIRTDLEPLRKLFTKGKIFQRKVTLM
jgi:hypothetical protein